MTLPTCLAALCWGWVTGMPGERLQTCSRGLAPGICSRRPWQKPRTGSGPPSPRRGGVMRVQQVGRGQGLPGQHNLHSEGNGRHRLHLVGEAAGVARHAPPLLQ